MEEKEGYHFMWRSGPIAVNGWILSLEGGTLNKKRGVPGASERNGISQRSGQEEAVGDYS